jgi:DNA primase
MLKVPDNVIAEVRDGVDLFELIGAYVNLKRSGRNFLGLCPFHQEKTPSFNVSPDRGIYHCFGCGVTGDAYRFLMEHDHLSFPEALRDLAGRAGIDLAPYERRGGDPGAADDFDLLYRAHAIAVRLYRDLLRGKEGEAARREIERRGLSREVVAEYRLGASADAWDRLLKVAGQEGIRPSVLERAGLAARRDTGPGHYDRFRKRLMFPIETLGSKVVGFGGRVLGEGEPKYLNSPESPLFRKRKVLYGFPQAQAEIRANRRAILVEGYTDVLALANVGIRGAIASLGTAFTSKHAAFLARSCDQVTVVFDGDEAGQKAVVASCGPLLGAGLETRLAKMPPGEDPDSLVRREGADAFRERLADASGVLGTLLGDEGYARKRGPFAGCSRLSRRSKNRYGGACTSRSSQVGLGSPLPCSRSSSRRCAERRPTPGDGSRSARPRARPPRPASWPVHPAASCRRWRRISSRFSCTTRSWAGR